MATSSSDGTARIWDLRSICVDQPKTLKKVSHKRVVQSTHFSPSGSSPTTTRDNTVGMVTGVNFDHTSMIKHDDQSGDSMSYFRINDEVAAAIKERKPIEPIKKVRRLGVRNPKTQSPIRYWSPDQVVVKPRTVVLTPLSTSPDNDQQRADQEADLRGFDHGGRGVLMS
ncbi:hypothetical protein CMV_025461 [Castanea mollissima]|uniref:Uncharacterized protein n=1 Tax=Castanea mollissima TaxID=60419 RepID=A0A8J4QDD3_9ROSI|nr:hypothetical protein CMV_025461 [Castanea mollissima]